MSKCFLGTPKVYRDHVAGCLADHFCPFSSLGNSSTPFDDAVHRDLLEAVDRTLAFSMLDSQRADIHERYKSRETRQPQGFLPQNPIMRWVS